MRTVIIGAAVALLTTVQAIAGEPKPASRGNADPVLAKLDTVFECPEGYPSHQAYCAGMGRFVLALSATSPDGQITQRQIAEARTEMLQRPPLPKDVLR